MLLCGVVYHTGHTHSVVTHTVQASRYQTVPVQPTALDGGGQKGRARTALALCALIGCGSAGPARPKRSLASALAVGRRDFGRQDFCHDSRDAGLLATSPRNFVSLAF